MQKRHEKYLNILKRTEELQAELQEELWEVSWYEYEDQNLELALAYLSMGEVENVVTLLEKLFAKYDFSLLLTEYDRTIVRLLGVYCISLLRTERVAQATEYIEKFKKLAEIHGVERIRLIAVYLHALKNCMCRTELECVAEDIAQLEKLDAEQVGDLLGYRFDVMLYELYGRYYLEIGEYEVAFSAYIQALELANRYYQEFEMIEIYRQISTVYEKMEDYRHALEYFRQYRKLYEAIYYAKNYAYSDYMISVYEQQSAETLKSDKQGEKIPTEIDLLTSTYNRRFLHRRMHELFVGEEGRAVDICAVMFDIDSLRYYNEEQGYLKGDELLKKIGGVLAEYKSERVYPIRYGGGEFLILLLGEQQADGEYLAEQILSTLRRKLFGILLSQEDKEVTLSVGLAAGSCKSRDELLELIERADERLYLSKRQGMNRFHCE